VLCADDAMAILAAFNSQEVEVIGLTSLFGNVRTPMATANAVFLRELADRHDVRPRIHCISHPRHAPLFAAFVVHPPAA